jgi:hypothetical protein
VTVPSPLAPGARYCVRLCAHNSAGWSPWSEPSRPASTLTLEAEAALEAQRQTERRARERAMRDRLKSLEGLVVSVVFDEGALGMSLTDRAVAAPAAEGASRPPVGPAGAGGRDGASGARGGAPSGVRAARVRRGGQAELRGVREGDLVVGVGSDVVGPAETVDAVVARFKAHPRPMMVRFMRTEAQERARLAEEAAASSLPSAAVEASDAPAAPGVRSPRAGGSSPAANEGGAVGDAGPPRNAGATARWLKRLSAQGARIKEKSKGYGVSLGALGGVGERGMALLKRRGRQTALGRAAARTGASETASAEKESPGPDAVNASWRRRDGGPSSLGLVNIAEWRASGRSDAAAARPGPSDAQDSDAQLEMADLEFFECRRPSAEKEPSTEREAWDEDEARRRWLVVSEGNVICLLEDQVHRGWAALEVKFALGDLLKITSKRAQEAIVIFHVNVVAPDGPSPTTQLLPFIIESAATRKRCVSVVMRRFKALRRIRKAAERPVSP